MTQAEDSDDDSEEYEFVEANKLVESRDDLSELDVVQTQGIDAQV